MACGSGKGRGWDLREWGRGARGQERGGWGQEGKRGGERGDRAREGGRQGGGENGSPNPPPPLGELVPYALSCGFVSAITATGL